MIRLDLKILLFLGVCKFNQCLSISAHEKSGFAYRSKTPGSLAAPCRYEDDKSFQNELQLVRWEDKEQNHCKQASTACEISSGDPQEENLGGGVGTTQKILAVIARCSKDFCHIRSVPGTQKCRLLGGR